MKNSFSFNSYLKNASSITDNIDYQLPDVLYELNGCFDNIREKDVVLLSAVTALSAVLNNVNTVYHRKRIYPNLFTFITGVSGIGKSSMRVVEELFKEVPTVLKDSGCPFNKLFFPADSSSAALMKALKNNDESGLIYETEADVMSNSFKQEWGDFSTIARKAHENERTGRLRLSDETEIELLLPRFSVLLSGTPNQIPKLFQNKDDGFLSRFLFYGYGKNIVFENREPKGFDEYSNTILNLQNRINNLTISVSAKPIAIKFDSEQWKLHKVVMTKLLEEFSEKNNEDETGIVFRLGAVCIKIAMILTVLRNETELRTVLKCNLQDFQSSLQITTSLFYHSMNINNMIFTNSKLRNILKPRVFNRLPNKFGITQAKNLFVEVSGLKERRMFEILNQWQELKVLWSPKKGRYEKLV